LQKQKYRVLFRVCKVYFLLFLFGIVLGASFVLSPMILSHFSGEQKTLHAAEPKENLSSKLEDTIQEVPNSNSDNQGPPLYSIQSNQGSDQQSGQDSSQDSSQDPSQDLSQDLSTDSSAKLSPSSNDKRINVLLVGVDRRPQEKSISNTDTIIVASVNVENGNVALISIPRDTQITIPGQGKTKINAAARTGNGLKTTAAYVEDLIGQPIDGYILTNFIGFKEVIDTLGGITLTVEKDMYYITGDKVDGIINLKKGTQHLNGAQALQYARFRQDALADITRTTRQQAVLKAMGRELLQVKTISKLPALIPQFMKSVETNLSVGKIWSLSNVLLRKGNPEILSQTLPGDFLTEDGISYWKVNQQRSRAAVRRLLEEGKTTSMFFK
jgi:polyisoprenyl-teichoic acid--peptidoglycan teichoic acid transferase